MKQCMFLLSAPLGRRTISAMDAHVVQTLNRWFASDAVRADLCRALAIVPLVAIGILVVLAWSTLRSNSPKGRSELLLGVLAALGALLLNLALGHLYYRARPFLVLDVRPLLPEAVDSSLFSDHLAVAGAAIAALFVARRTFGWIALGLGVLLAVGRIGAGVQYTSDCLVGAAVGAVCFFVLLPLRSPPLARDRRGLPRHRRAGDEARTRLHPPAPPGDLDRRRVPGVRSRIRDPSDPGSRMEGRGAPGGGDAAGELGAGASPDVRDGADPYDRRWGKSRATYATVVGDVTQVSHELDGDYHIRVEGHGAFLLLEIMPEFPLASPQDWTYRKNDRDIGGASSSVPPLAHDRRPSLLDGAVAEHEPGPATLGT
jgi:undecaprenyl-diphosphatase